MWNPLILMNSSICRRLDERDVSMLEKSTELHWTPQAWSYHVSFSRQTWVNQYLASGDVPVIPCQKNVNRISDYVSWLTPIISGKYFNLRLYFIMPKPTWLLFWHTELQRNKNTLSFYIHKIKCSFNFYIYIKYTFICKAISNIG